MERLIVQITAANNKPSATDVFMKPSFRKAGRLDISLPLCYDLKQIIFHNRNAVTKRVGPEKFYREISVC